jgi:2-keto-3-deoxy-L-rhamnonate aldolase RhmA
LIGTIVTLPTPAVAEMLADVGFDWLFVDMEHGPLEGGELTGILQAVGERAACLVRVPAAEEFFIKRVLDMGATGIIVPQVDTPQQAADIVRFARYAPDGMRGVGLGRAHGYGLRFQEYLETANERVTVIVQAEHAEAVRNIEAIVEVPGVDGVLLGPYDLSASLGKTGQLNDPEVVAAIDRVIETCRGAGMPFGYFGVTAEALRPFIDRGCTLLVAGVDTMHLATAAQEFLSQLR